MTSVRRAGVAALLVLLASCKGREISGVTAGRQIQATVITIRTITEPPRRETTSTITIAGDVVRLSDELDEWRLFDVRANRVTFVNDVDRSFRTESLQSLLAERRKVLARDPGPQIPEARFAATGARRKILGVDAAQAFIRSGSYARELWIGSHPVIPERLFALMHISRIPTSSIAGMARQADEALSSVRGFPLVDRSEVPLGGETLIVERTVVKIEKKLVPTSYLKVPVGYSEIKPGEGSPAAPRRAVTAPGERRRPAS